MESLAEQIEALRVGHEEHAHEAYLNSALQHLEATKHNLDLYEQGIEHEESFAKAEAERARLEDDNRRKMREHLAAVQRQQRP